MRKCSYFFRLSRYGFGFFQFFNKSNLLLNISHIHLIAVFALMLSVILGFQPAWALEFRQPECRSLEQWSAGAAPNEIFSIAPEIKITGLLKDELTRPLFGSTVEEWGAEQFRTLGGWLQKCRNAASKRKAQTASRNLYSAMKAVRSASSTMSRAERMQNSAAKSIQALLDFPPAPGVSEVIAMAQDALRGIDVRDRMAAIRSREARTAAGNIHNIQQAYGYLPEGKRIAFIARLDQTKETAQVEMNEIDQEMQAARKQLAAAPYTEEGLRTVMSLFQLPVLDKVTPEDARAFRNEAQQKRWAIQKALEQQKAKQAAVVAAKPIDIESRLAELFVGTKVKDLSIRGLKLGMTKDQAVNLMQNSWRYEFNGMGLIVDMPWMPIRQDGPRYKSERRDGGMADLEVMDNDRVGQIDFMEHYMGMVISSTPQAWLTARLGEPDQVGGNAVVRLMTWNNGPQHLQVRISSRVEVMWANAGFKSQMEISLWSDDFESYLEKLNRRCAEIRSKPRNEWSVEEGLLFGQKCPLGTEAHLTAGL
jgi:hypothetical protein